MGQTKPSTLKLNNFVCVMNKFHSIYAYMCDKFWIFFTFILQIFFCCPHVARFLSEGSAKSNIYDVKI